MDEELFKPCIDLQIKGDGIAINRAGLRLNPVGETTYRVDDDNGGLLERYEIKAFAYNKKIDCNIHTWLSNGKHLDLLDERGIELDVNLEKKIKVEKDGKELELEIRICYYEAR